MLLAGCGQDRQVAAPPTAAPTTYRPVPPRAPAPAPPAAPDAYWVPLAAEPMPELKTVASAFVQRLTTALPGQQPADVLVGALPFTGPGFDVAATLATAAPLFVEARSAGTVVYPQFGGLDPLSGAARTASVMVVVRQRLTTPSGATTDVTRTCDVRLEVDAGAWRVVSLSDVGGEPVDRPAGLDPRALRVLDDPRIELPDSARWDVHAGSVALPLLDLLADTAALQPLAVTVLRRGHPVNVYGTDRTSGHTQGRAADVWRVGTEPVVATGAATEPTAAVLRSALADRRLTQAGSPTGTDQDARRSRSFTDLVHSDHLHLAVAAGP